MKYKEIRALRKANKLEEALDMAIKAHETNPADIYVVTELAWVYYDYLKNSLEHSNFMQFFEIFNKILSLGLNFSYNELLRERLLWQINNAGWALLKLKYDTSRQLKQLLQIASHFPPTKSEANSVVTNMFIAAFKSDKKAYLNLIDWQGFDNFISEEDGIIDKEGKLLDDFKFKKHEGSKQLSVVEKYLGTYCKHLLINNPNSKELNQLRRIQLFMPILETSIINHPEYEWLPYYKAQLLSVLGEHKNALETIIPFVRKNQNQSWSWDKLGDITKDPEEKIAFYCRALLCKNKEEMLLKIRTKLIPLLLNKSDFSAAKYELDKILLTREKNIWEITKNLNNWKKSSWYLNNQANDSNNSLYKKHSSLANDLVFDKIEAKDIIITWLNKEKRLAGFEFNDFERENATIKGENTADLVIFNTYSVKLITNKHGFLEAVTKPKPTRNLALREKFVRPVEGIVRIHRQNSFGFIKQQDGDVFVSPEIINKNELLNGDPYSGFAIKTWHRQKEMWSWSITEDPEVTNW
ncbi:MAG: hypothetical protein QM211_02105 [Bacillota bacterium]|nr:hypothetical protein [Bacillota bacterium]